MPDLDWTMNPPPPFFFRKRKEKKKRACFELLCSFFSTQKEVNLKVCGMRNKGTSG